jgi:L-aminopeptidase/D-esterase-like protein
MTAPAGSITDVGGMLVGHHDRRGRGWRTGTTVVLAPHGAVAGVDVRGGGPGTRETDALAPTNLIETIHGICLTGGSAYGLAAADGVMSWLEERDLGFPIGTPEGGRAGVVPVVPTAVIFDLGRGGSFANRPDPAFGRRAAASARSRQRRWGSVGAGTGAIAGGLQGGVGTAATSVTVPIGPPDDHRDDPRDDQRDGAPPTVDISVGAVAVVNSSGSTVDASTGLPWEARSLRLRRPSAADRARLRETLEAPQPWSLNTTIGVVATSARLSKSEATKLAGVSHDGLARAIRPAHGLVDGDTVFGLATGRDELAGYDEGQAPIRVAALNLLFAAAADVFATACTHAVISATPLGDPPAYRDLCPTALSSMALSPTTI